MKTPNFPEQKLFVRQVNRLRHFRCVGRANPIAEFISETARLRVVEIIAGDNAGSETNIFALIGENHIALICRFEEPQIPSFV